MKFFILFAFLTGAHGAFAGQDYLVKLKSDQSVQNMILSFGGKSKVKSLNFNQWIKVNLSKEQVTALKSQPEVLHVEKNGILKIQTNLEVFDSNLRQWAKDQIAFNPFDNGNSSGDNPPFPSEKSTRGTGSDPAFSNQWGMEDIGVEEAWQMAGTMGNEDVIVAVIDTGVDYTHEDLVTNMWRNPGESGTDEEGNDLATNGIDDDGNGYIDDHMGWDFAADDNKPYDLAKKGFSLLLGGNPGHGTHCAGNVAARGDNGIGVAGVAPHVKIMGLRFISENGEGTTESAVNSIRYAVDNGAQILSNSWGSEGDGGDVEASRVLQEAIEYAQDNNVLFVAAAGNGHRGVGYDNDTDSRPAYPASYDQDTILSVAALDVEDKLGSFSNWGEKTVDIGAPGVKVFSTIPGNDYQDTVINFPPLLVATWDGTSMSAPHVSGAAALYLSANPDATYADLKKAIIDSAETISSLDGKSVSNGKLNVKAMMEE